MPEINFDLDYQFLKDSYTGRGGYLDGSYLVRFPNESDTKFKNRKESKNTLPSSTSAKR